MRMSIVAMTLALSFSSLAQTASSGTVIEYPVNYPTAPAVETGACHAAPTGSTHEITFKANNGQELWITGQNYDRVVKVAQNGAMTFYEMPEKSGPHGIEFDEK